LAASFNLALVAVVFTLVLTGYNRDFINMIKQRRIVEIKSVEAEELSKANFILANEDSLTGLANRRSFLSKLTNDVCNAELGQLDGLAVGILDLDGFKLINDVYGHPTGDRLLKAVGIRLSDLFCERVFISRLGGDEFGLIISGVIGEEELTGLGEKICGAMQVPFEIGELVANLSGSVGFSVWEGIKDNAERLFENADYALYHSKDNARGGVTIFNEQHAATIREVSGVDRRLQDANLEDEMSLVFQPILTPRNIKTIGFEVLARWNSPILGHVSPDVFIRSAERAGMINRLTAVLLKMALKEAKNWPQDVFMSFNLSMQDITSSRAILNLISIVNASGFDPGRITFEVTETSMMNDYERAMDSLNMLKNLGAKIARDDFGTGYSSLAYVRAMPLDKLKLDRSFITEIESDEDAGAIVHTMIDLCRNLKLDCIVEGVETSGQLDVLNALGCEIIQGYYFSMPLNATDALAYIGAEQKLEQAC
jgi:diguanylate cyclase (GGDEF)-like protein